MEWPFFWKQKFPLQIYCALMLNNENQPIGIEIIEDAKRSFITHELGGDKHKDINKRGAIFLAFQCLSCLYEGYR